MQYATIACPTIRCFVVQILTASLNTPQERKSMMTPWGATDLSYSIVVSFLLQEVSVANMDDAIPRKYKGMLLFTFRGNKEKTTKCILQPFFPF
jgi:hypothetical protein